MKRDITIYIKELLFGHDCVIVPGFGAFIGNYSQARVDHAEGLFYPPVKKITFNRHLVNNDGLLIGHISSRESIGYGEARDVAESFTEELKARINRGEKVQLDNIGSFYFNRDRVLIFEPDPEANYLLSSFGLTSFHRSPVKDFDLRRKVLESKDNEPVKISSMRRMMTRAAVIIPLLVAMALIPFRTELFKSKTQESNMNPLAVAELEYNRSQILHVNPTTVDSSSHPEETVTSSAKEEPPTVQVNNITTSARYVAPAVPVAEVGIKYMLVTGSFKDEENALSMIRRLQMKGFSPVVAEGPNGFFRVSAGSFETQQAADSALKQVIRIYPKSWICKTE
jgi:cell division septation protein DedD